MAVSKGLSIFHIYRTSKGGVGFTRSYFREK